MNRALAAVAPCADARANKQPLVPVEQSRELQRGAARLLPGTMRALVTLAVMLLATPAAADRELHGGLDVRTDLGTHHTRLALGMRACAWDTTLVLDPMVALDGQHDLDLIVERYFGARVAVLAGIRWSAVAVDGGYHHQDRTLLGVTGAGPRFFDGALLTKFSLEVATLWVKHGGGAETDWISGDRNLIDHFSLGLFVRIEYARSL